MIQALQALPLQSARSATGEFCPDSPLYPPDCPENSGSAGSCLPESIILEKKKNSNRVFRNLKIIYHDMCKRIIGKIQKRNISTSPSYDCNFEISKYLFEKSVQLRNVLVRSRIESIRIRCNWARLIWIE